MSTVRIGRVGFEGGMPKICLPITAVSEKELIEEAKKASACEAADLVEWRADWYDCIFEKNILKNGMTLLHGILKEKPVLFTLRTDREGGKAFVSDGQYEAVLAAALDSGADAIDLEFSRGEQVKKVLLPAAKKLGIPVILSCHDFEKTPSSENMAALLESMYRTGADFCKLAVMPGSPKDTLRLLEVTCAVKEKYPEGHFITMSMSDIGVMTRMSGEIYGSELTFGTIGKVSAPGQVDAVSLKSILELIHSGRK